MTDEEANKVLRDAIGMSNYCHPCTDAEDEVFVREWAKWNMTTQEHSRVMGDIQHETQGRSDCAFWFFDIRTGDLARAVAQVLSERKGVGDA